MLARGFGTTLGIGTTDAITTAHTDHFTLNTWAIWSLRNAAGGGALGRLFDKGTNQLQLTYRDASTEFRFDHGWNGGATDAAWGIPAPSASVWHHTVVTYDTSSTTNDPVMYVDGVSQTVTEVTAPVGAAFTTTDPYILGNRSDAIRNWDGGLSEFAHWNRILTIQEIKLLSEHWAPTCFPIGLQTYRPGSMSSAIGRPPGTITGTKVMTGVPFIMTPRSGIDRWVAVGT